MIQPSRFQVAAGPHDRRHCPVRVKLEQAGRQALALLHEETGRTQPCQVELRPDGSSWLVWVISQLEAGLNATYRVVDAGPTPRRISDTVRFVDLDAGRMGVRSGRTWLATVGLEPSHSHAGWTWIPAIPATATSQATGPSPEVRNGGLWLGHGNVSGIDHLQAGARSGADRPITVEAREDGIVAGRLVLQAHWGGLERPLLEEWTVWTVYPAVGTFRLADLDVWLRATAGPVVFGGEGISALPGFGLAGALTASEGARWQNASGGIGPAEIDGWRSDWVGVTTAGDELTLALLVHPFSFGAPPVWRLESEQLLHADPFDFGPWVPRSSARDRRLAVGSEIELHARLVVCAGDIRKARLQERFADYAYPPVITALADET